MQHVPFTISHMPSFFKFTQNIYYHKCNPVTLPKVSCSTFSAHHLRASLGLSSRSIISERNMADGG